MKIKLTNLDESFQYAKMFLVDDDHGSPLKLWETMGRPPFPSLQQQADLRTAAELAPPQTLKLVKNEFAAFPPTQRLGCHRVYFQSAMTIKDDESIEIQTPRGAMRTYIFRPVAEGRYPGLVLFSEIFQVTGPIRRSAALVAGHGFIVAVPEVFHEFEEPGTVLPYDQAGADRGNADKIAKELSSYDDDARLTISYLRMHPKCTGKLGAMGFCIGGHLAFRAAMNPEVLAATCCYPTDIHKRSLGKGLNDNSLDRIPDIKGELLIVFGRQDPHVPREGRAVIYNALADANSNFSWHEFNGAHAFMRDEGARYDAAAARIVYGMALELFKRKLGEGDVAASPTSDSNVSH